MAALGARRAALLTHPDVGQSHQDNGHQRAELSPREDVLNPHRPANTHTVDERQDCCNKVDTTGTSIKNCWRG